LFTAILRDASERRAGEARLRHQALHDTLTRLPNRALFSEHLELAVARRGRQTRQLAVMFLDLDRFKVINDSLGHAAGDDLLCQVANRLRATVRPGDVLARLGGDEFAVLLEGVMPLAATSVARRILERFDEPFVIENQSLHVATSIGIAHTADEHQSASDLLRHADAAMYQAKARGRGRFEVFDEPMRASLHRRLQTETELHAALARGEIAVHYQPLLDLRSRKIARIEALARWDHPQRGLLAAEEFIDVAEETGLIKLLGLHVARQTAQQLSAWRDDLGDAAPQVAINLSPSQLAVPIDPILEVTEGYMHHLAIEITESALMTDVDRVADRLRDLKDRGATVIIDDFGTGYSSLAALKRLPIDVIKIDRAFVDGVEDDADDRAIVNAIIQLGHALGIAVVAEGVETAGQLSILEALECDLAQGYLISPPRSAGDVLALTSS
jgi:diguanylate cyclase (GGDEF)-like protein